MENRKIKDIKFNLFFAKIRSYKDKVAGWEFCNRRS